MTPEQRNLCTGLLISPLSGTQRVSKVEFLRQFSSALEEGILSSALIEKAYRDRNAEDLQCALIIGNAFGFSFKHQDILCLLANADWHFSHEGIVGPLEKLQTSKAIEALYQLTQWIPAYLDYDESRALAVNAIWALGRIPGVEAEQKLIELSNSNDPILQKGACQQLQRRRKNISENK